MQRNEWSFEYTASKLAEAAQIKREHHRQRFNWWNKQKDAVMVEVKDSGLEVSESLAMSHSSANPRMGPQVMVETIFSASSPNVSKK